MTDNQHVVGIFTGRDAGRAIADQPNLYISDVASLMTRQVLTIAESEAANSSIVVQAFRRYRGRHLPVVNSRENIIAIATPQSVRAALKPAALLRMRRVNEAMKVSAVCASSKASVQEVVKLVARRQTSYRVIIEDSEKLADQENQASLFSRFPHPFIPQSAPVILIGILTEGDVVQFQALGLEFTETLVGVLISTPLPVRSHRNAVERASRNAALPYRAARRRWGRG